MQHLVIQTPVLLSTHCSSTWGLAVILVEAGVLTAVVLKLGVA